MSRNPSRVFALSLILLFTVGSLTSCGTSKKAVAPTAPLTTTQANDAAVQAAALIMAGGSPSPIPAGLVSQGPSGLASIRRARLSSAAAETTIVGEDFTWTFAIRWFNGFGVEQPEYNPLTTVRMVADSHGEGSYLGPHGTMTLGTAGHLDIGGIAAWQDSTVTNATQNDTLAYVFVGDNGTATFHALCSGAFTDVLEMKPSTGNYPMSGSASWSLDVTKQIEGPSGTASEHFMASAVVTFNGTHLVPLVINGTWQFMLDLDTGQVTSVTA